MEHSTLIFENLKPVEPQPPNFENLYNFQRCSNDAKMIFLISLLVLDFQKSVWSVPSIPVAVLDLCYHYNHKIFGTPLCTY